MALPFKYRFLEKYGITVSADQDFLGVYNKYPWKGSEAYYYFVHDPVSNDFQMFLRDNNISIPIDSEDEFLSFSNFVWSDRFSQDPNFDVDNYIPDPPTDDFEYDLYKIMNMEESGYFPTVDDVSFIGDYGSGDKWGAPVLGKDGNLYSFGYYERHLKLDTVTGIPSLFGSNKGFYYGGTLAKDGCIYAFSYNQSKVCKIDIDTLTVLEFPCSFNGIASTFLGKDDGKIYGCPSGGGSVAVFDPVTYQFESFGSLVSGTFRWVGSAYGKDGKVYCFGRYSSTFLQIDLKTRTVVEIPFRTGYIGSVMGKDGNIYGSPIGTTFSKYNVDTGELSSFGSLPSVGNAYQGGVLAPNGRIYFCPRDAQGILELDTDTLTSVYFPVSQLTGTNKFSGVVLAPNGKAYFFPTLYSSIMVLNLGEIKTKQLLSKYFNKF